MTALRDTTRIAVLILAIGAGLILQAGHGDRYAKHCPDCVHDRSETVGKS